MIDKHREILALHAEHRHLKKRQFHDLVSTHLNIQRELVADRVRNALIRAKLDGTGEDTFNLPHKAAHVINRFQGDDFTVLSDTEGPTDTSLEYLERVAQVSKWFGITRAIHAGDFAAWDQKAVNLWSKSDVFDDVPESVEQTIVVSQHILDVFRKKVFHEQWIQIPGNHDERPGRATNGTITYKHLINDSRYDGWLHFSPYPRIVVETSRGIVHIGHPKKYNRTPIQLAQKLYNPMQEKGAVILPHCHIQQDGFTTDNLHEIHCIGTGRDPDKTDYLASTWSDFPHWNQSFLIIKGGHFYPFNIQFTDFKHWEKLLVG